MDNCFQETLVKVTFRCTQSDKKHLTNSDCILHISVGQQYHEDEKFAATMDLINKTFNSCKIMLCDTLQRHTLQVKNPDLSDQEAYDKALSSGNQWLERNRHIYENLTIKHEIMRWDSWLNHKDYSKYRKEIDALYNTNKDYQQSILKTIEKFLRRNHLSDDKRAFELCKEYVLEECPILVPLWATTKANFVVYPRFRTPAMKATYDYYLGNSKEQLLQEVALKFNRRTIPKKLSFSYTY